jgi:hypothetical protein
VFALGGLACDNSGLPGCERIGAVGPPTDPPSKQSPGDPTALSAIVARSADNGPYVSTYGIPRSAKLANCERVTAERDPCPHKASEPPQSRRGSLEGAPGQWSPRLS